MFLVAAYRAVVVQKIAVEGEKVRNMDRGIGLLEASLLTSADWTNRQEPAHSLFDWLKKGKKGKSLFAFLLSSLSDGTEKERNRKWH